jgi:hypothetical protein
MKNLESEFIPYNLALRMKALSYKEKVLTYYENGVPKLYNDILGWDFNSSFLTCCSRPTFQSAFNWFRKKYGLYSWIQLHNGYINDSFYPELPITFSIMDRKTGNKYYERDIPHNYLYKTNEKAEIACLKKLIEIVEQKQLKND